MYGCKMNQQIILRRLVSTLPGRKARSLEFCGFASPIFFSSAASVASPGNRPEIKAEGSSHKAPSAQTSGLWKPSIEAAV